MSIPLVIAHRGDSSESLENSIDSIHRALSYPVDMIELDIRKSLDNVLYVMHDKMTGRTAERNINIEHETSDVISKIKLINGEPVPTIEDVIKTVAGSTGLNIEIKSSGAGVLIAQYFAATYYPGYVLLSSFEEDEVRAVRHILPVMPTSVIYDVFSFHDVKSYKKRGYKIIILRKNTVNEKLIKACHEEMIDVYVWTVDEEDEMQKFISLGVDGIYSNRPGVLKTLLMKLQAAAEGSK
ncbi:MAG TPA: glycerophosphodiester phosphodiesterase [Nitrospirota bacterium]|nr:glycerophosphodiester phosphodiesterase [Nitrospirota bacterium]